MKYKMRKIEKRERYSQAVSLNFTESDSALKVWPKILKTCNHASKLSTKRLMRLGNWERKTLP